MATPDGGDPEPAEVVLNAAVVVRRCLHRMTAATLTTPIPDSDGGSVRGVAVAVLVGGKNPSFPPLPCFAVRHQNAGGGREVGAQGVEEQAEESLGAEGTEEYAATSLAEAR
jgi:hypothetical protein